MAEDSGDQDKVQYKNVVLNNNTKNTKLGLFSLTGAVIVLCSVGCEIGKQISNYSSNCYNADKESKYPECRDQVKIRNILDEDPLSAELSFDLVDWWDSSKYVDTAVKDPAAPQFDHKVINEG